MRFGTVCFGFVSSVGPGMMVPASIRGFILFVPFCPVLVPWDIRGTSTGQVKAEEYFGMKLLKTEILLLNKTDDIIRFTCDSIVVNECAVDISVFTDIPGMSRLISTLDSDATIYMKYGISEIETFSMVFEYRGDTIGRFKTKRTDTIEIK